MLAPGDQIHHYIVEAAIGGGGMATVYRVRHAILQAPLALKVLDPRWVDRPDLRKRFLAEGRIQALVRHPAIVMVTDAVVDAPLRIAGLVMEYVEGPNLAELVARMQAPPDPALVRSIALPVLEAIHHAHSEGVIHRDLKPSNVLLSRDGAGVWHPRVADFGIAHVHEAATRLTKVRVTETEGRLGTPAFMAPEQIAGEVPDRRWDVFALGCVLYELATGGVHPFERDTDSGTLAAIQAGVYRDPREIVPDLDDGVLACIVAALDPDPDARAPDCATLIRLLDRKTGGLAPAPVHAAPPASVAAPSSEIPPSFVETTGPAHERKAWRLRSAEVRVGRQDLEVSLGTVANLEAEHCAFLWDGSGWILEDRSTVGTRVNGARVTHIRLEDGDLVGVGHQMLKFHTVSTGVRPMEPAPEVVPEVPAVKGPHLEVAARLVRGDHTSDPVRIPVSFEGIVIGRADSCEIPLEEPSAAPRHCRVRLQGIDVVVEDLGSAAGTRVDGQSVRFRRLADGASIEIGSAVLRYRQR
ncbi:MAG: FHA domain-containing serine/threonine-protein kinase [Myxococcota bacterium]